MTTANNTKEQAIGFSENVDWQKYILFRPLYAPSFYSRIFHYHASKTSPPSSTAPAPASSLSWDTAHDVGAGCGIVSGVLASKFNHVVVSDATASFVELAQELLVGKAGFAASKFAFKHARAEEADMVPGSVDLVTACECIHWMDTGAAVDAFGKQLKSGGTLAIAVYYIPSLGNPEAEKHWRSIWNKWIKLDTSPIYLRAYSTVNSGLESIGFPEDTWTDVKRVYTNTHGSLDVFRFSDEVGASQVRDGEGREFVEGDPAWTMQRDIAWLKGYAGTFVPQLPEEDVSEHWDAIDAALQGGTVAVEFPVVMILATKK